MKIALFERPSTGGGLRAGVLVESGVVDASDVVRAEPGRPAQEMMEKLIDRFDEVRPALAELEQRGSPLALSEVRLRAPLPRPGKMICMIGNYWEHAQREARPANFFLKSPEAIIGPGDTIRLPSYQASVFHHEAELGLVIKGPAKDVPADRWREAIFGYTCFTDVSARGEGRVTAGAGSFMGKSFDTFAPIGPCITTADSIEDPNALHVQYWVNGQTFHDYQTNDMEHRVPELISFISSFMTLRSGDVIACGTNHEGLGPLQDGDVGEIEIEQIGRMSMHVVDPLKRTWERSIYLGPGTTARQAEASPST